MMDIHTFRKIEMCLKQDLGWKDQLLVDNPLMMRCFMDLYQIK